MKIKFLRGIIFEKPFQTRRKCLSFEVNTGLLTVQVVYGPYTLLSPQHIQEYQTQAVGAAACIDICHGNTGTAFSHSANGGSYPAG